MRLAINLVLVALAFFLVYALYASIREPIAFKNEVERRKNSVTAKLMKIRTAQEAYRDITGEFAPTFDTLSQVLNTGQFKIIKVIGDPDDPNFNGVITYDTLYRPARDSMRSVLSMNNFDSLRYCPFTGGKVFDIEAKVIEYQKTKVPVVEVGIPWKEFMGKYADPSYNRYDQSYDPSKPIKFGSLYAPNLSGNWEG
jgi:uncharacterized protein with FMN-binding domain